VLRRLSLRARLLLGVIALAGVGLLVADVVTYSELQSFLIRRTDSSLNAAHQAVEAVLLRPQGGPTNGHGGDDHGPGGGPGPGLDALTAAAPGDYIQLRRLNGTVVASGVVPRFSNAKQPPLPRLPTTIDLPPATGHGDRVKFLTVGAMKGGGRYRVRASIEPQAQNYVLIVAAPLSDVDSTLHRLLWIEGLVTALVLVAIGALGLWVVRLSLRPLTAIGATAAAIAGGDLSRRVDRAEPRTEVGRLGLALNAMLSQIETAFRARESSERKLRRFVADASHELRTPLAAVRAYAELFDRGAATRPDDLARSMSGITRETERMSLLVDDLLLLARLDEGRPLAREPVELADVVAEAVDAARVVEPDRTVEATLEPTTVIGDRDRLRQVVDNLFANVRAHTPPKTPVAVGLRHVVGTAELTVADAGPGLTEEEAAHVFERFYRVDTSRTRASGGVGLGLSIVAAVAEAHGGSVRVRPTPGGGATFVIELPIARNAPDGGQTRV
jgi:two-component system OmpR family sensor kinase